MRDKLKRLLMSILTLALANMMLYASEGSGVSINVKDMPIEQVLRRIEKQTPYRFSFKKKDIRNFPAVTLSCRNENVKTVLDRIFKNSELSYEIVSEKFILILPASKSSDSGKGLVDVKGRVTDTSGEPLTGATILIKGSSSGVAADIDGYFSLLNVPASSIIHISMVGYMPREYKASDRKALSDVVLEENSEILDAVVVVGYGKQSSKLLTTSISSLKIDDVDQGNDYNPIKMLQGRAAGVSVSTPSGKPGDQPNIRVRGIASITGNATPLYVVDGVPNDNMPYLNPNDIERMDVLKDASATAIYGSRANNGVIIITTKTGKRDSKTTFNASARQSFGWVAHDIKMANSAEYARTMQQAVDNYNMQFQGTGKALETFIVPDNVVDTDWVGALQRSVAKGTNANISMTGGGEKTTFYNSIGYNTQEGILRKTNFSQINVRGNFSHVISRIFKYNINLSGSYTSEKLSEEGDGSLKIIRSAREQQPWIAPYDENGDYTVLGTHLLRHNPVMVLNEEDQRNNRLEGIGSINLEVTPVKGLKWIPSISYYGKYSDGKKTLTEKHAARGTTAGWGAISQQRNTTYRMVIDNVLSYEDVLSRLTYSVMAGHSYEKYAYEQFGVKSDNYKDNAFPSSNFGLVNSGTSIYPGSFGYNAYALESYFGRIALNWDNKYILNATLRSDGSSRFPKNNRYGTFPSASVAWRVTNEPFFPDGSVVDDLKVRLSWGNTGSMAGISDWAAMSLVTSNTSSSYNKTSGLKVGNTAGNLTWEKSTQYNLGVDAELFDSRLRLNLDAYYQKTKGLLYNTNIIATSGYTGRTANRGQVENRGLEFSAGIDLFRGDFKWTISANASYTKNKLLQLDGNIDKEIMAATSIQGGSYHALIVGKPVSAYYMYRMDGLYQKDSEVPEKLYKKGVRAGDVRYRDLDGDGDISATDRMYVGKVTPDVTGGITSNMSWKGFDLSVFCQFSFGGKILAAWRGSGSNEGTEALGYGGGQSFKFMKDGVLVSNKQYFNISKYVANHYWNGEGTSNDVPRPVLKNTFSGGFANYLTSTRYLEDASYFKFKTITLGYSLPKSVVSKAKINSVRVYVSLDNFFTISKYSGYDPEFSYSSSPASSTYGADFGEQATLKSFIVGVNVNF